MVAATASASFLPLDTPEVAHAKAQHLAAVEQTKLRNALGSTHLRVQHTAPASHGWYASGLNQAWAAPVVVHNGHVQDTPEVADAKARHLAILASETARNSVPVGHYSAPSWNYASGPAQQQQWHPSEGYLKYGPAHIVVVNGHVQDTPEVAAAKAKHIAALQGVGTSHGAW